MKTHKIILILTAFALLGCESFVETDMPQSELTGPTVFTDEYTATAALSDIYARLREGGMLHGNTLGMPYLMGAYADELEYYGGSTNTIGAFYTNSVLPNNDGASFLWSTTYAQIYAANAVIEGVRASSLPEAVRSQLEGEALFIRAMLHFNLANLFGDVPYVTTTDYRTNAVISKMTIAEVYQLVIADLDEASSLIADDYAVSDRVRPNHAAVKAFLARVHLYDQNWAAAETAATTVIENPAYTWPAIENEFLKDSPATIWQLHTGAAGITTHESLAYIFTSGPPPNAALSESLFNAFEPGDLRREYWIGTVTGTDTWHYAAKYKDNVIGGVEYSILLRLAEQYLIRAEARAHLGDIVGARADLDVIRNRAGLPGTTAQTASELLAAILQERRVELFLESGHRWFDLKRTGNADAVLSPIKPSWQPTDILLPLPELELLLNGNLLPQNPGY